MKKFKLALCQMNVEDNKVQNIKKALSLIDAAARNNAQMAVLPEMFNCPYSNSVFREYAEKEDGETIKSLSKISKELGIYVVAGSIPEQSGDNVYNTSFILDCNGEIIGKHRKVHLFDIDVEGKITFRESDTLSAGNQITVIDTEYCRIGVCICYDMRFPEIMRLMSLKGAEMVIIPAAFNMTTGPAHWEALIRIRAIDNQVYVAAASPARNENAEYIAYGNSMVVDPWGNIIERAGAEEAIIYSDIEPLRLEKVRNELPLLKHRRTDMYEVKEK